MPCVLPFGITVEINGQFLLSPPPRSSHLTPLLSPLLLSYPPLLSSPPLPSSPPLLTPLPSSLLLSNPPPLLLFSHLISSPLPGMGTANGDKSERTRIILSHRPSVCLAIMASPLCDHQPALGAWNGIDSFLNAAESFIITGVVRLPCCPLLHPPPPSHHHLSSRLLNSDSTKQQTLHLQKSFC